jgi:hypothetical protein
LVIGKCNHFVLAHQITSPEPPIRRNTSRYHDLKLWNCLNQVPDEHR